MLAQLTPIAEVTTLGWACDDIAKSYMDFIVRRANHILPKHGWRVHTLKEFYPRGGKLLGLNVNKGSEVCVRLRVPGSKAEFLPFHEVLCTALHEFAHCAVSAHNKAFWTVYYGLVKECEALETQMVARGESLYPPLTTANTPSGYYAPRHQMGAGASGGRRLGSTRAKAKAPNGTPTTTAALASTTHEESLTTTTYTIGWGVGHRLGGGNGKGSLPASNAQGASPPSATEEALRKILADAVLRRRRMAGSDACCAELEVGRATPTTLGNEGLEEDSSLPDEPPPSQLSASDGEGNWVCARCTYCNPTTARTCLICTDVNEQSRSPSPVPTTTTEGRTQSQLKRDRSESQASLYNVQDSSWECAQCTFVNISGVSYCEMCKGGQPQLKVVRLSPSCFGNVSGFSAQAAIEISDSDDIDC